MQEGQEKFQLQVSCICFLCFPELQHMGSSWLRSLRSSSPVWTQYLHILLVYHLLISGLLPVCFCRAFNFQRHNRKCHLLPFDRFTHGVQKQANVNFTLYEKKGKCVIFRAKVDLFALWHFLMRTFRGGKGLTQATCLLVIACCASCDSSSVFKLFGFGVDIIKASNPFCG